MFLLWCFSVLWLEFSVSLRGGVFWVRCWDIKEKGFPVPYCYLSLPLFLTGYGPTEHGEAAALRHRLWACILGAQLITAEGKSVKIGGGESSQEKIGIVGQLSISIA